MKFYFLLFADFVKAFRLFKGTFIFLRYLFVSRREILVPGYSGKIYLRKNSSDLDAYRQIFLQKSYETTFPEHPEVIIDAGANIGLFTVFMKLKFPDSRIICIEPDESNFGMLTRNTERFNKVSLENCGIWARSTNLKITDKYNFGSWGMVTEETEEPGTLKAISIVDIMSKYGIPKIDILKIDIETSEKILFESNYQEWLPKVQMIIIELHDWLTVGCGQSFFNAVHNTFKNYSYLVVGDNTVIINNDRVS